MKPDKIKTLSKVFGTILCISLISAFLLYLLSGNYKDYTAVSSDSSLVNAEDTVCFTDVGQGDCTLIYSRGRTALIDTGTPESAHKLCKSLRSKGIKTIDALIITHFHDDHYGGANEIAEMFEIKNLIMPDMAKTDENIADVTELKKSVFAEDNEVYVARKGMNFSVGNFNLTIVGYYPDLSEENDRSICIMAENKGKRILFTGDASSSVEERLQNDGIDLNCDILKIGHHGSSSSTSENFLSATSPDYAIISCGENNIYGHPHKLLLERLTTHKSDIYRTDKSGDIVFELKDGKITDIQKSSPNEG